MMVGVCALGCYLKEHHAACAVQYKVDTGEVRTAAKLTTTEPNMHFSVVSNPCGV